MSPNEEKSLKIFLKIILKKIKKNTRNEEPIIRLSDILDSTLSLNKSFSSEKISEIRPSSRSHSISSNKSTPKRKDISIKIKLDISNPDCPDTDPNLTIHKVTIESSQSTKEGMEFTFDTNQSVSQNPECFETSETELSKTGESLFENCSHENNLLEGNEQSSHEENANEMIEKPETNSNEVSRSDYEIRSSNGISKRKRVPSCESVNHIWSLIKFFENTSSNDQDSRLENQQCSLLPPDSIQEHRSSTPEKQKNHEFDNQVSALDQGSCDENKGDLVTSALNVNVNKCNSTPRYLEYTSVNNLHSTIMSSCYPDKKSGYFSETDEKISSLIHQLIMERYKEVLHNFSQRKINRELSKSSPVSHVLVSPDDKETITADSYNEVESEVGNFIDENRKIDGSNEDELRVIIDDSEDNTHTYVIGDRSMESACRRESTDSGLNYSEDCLESNGNSMDLLKSSADSIDIFGSERGSNQVSHSRSESSLSEEYDEHRFLSVALGEELMNVTTSSSTLSVISEKEYQQYYSTPKRLSKLYGTEKSIGSSGISGLISATEPRRTSEIYSLYSTVNKTEKKKHRDARDVLASNAVFDSNDTMRNNDYESVSHLSVNPKEGELLSENTLQREIIYQISKALLICRSQSTVITRDVHVEAEKILLVATCKKNLINEKLTQIYYEDTYNPHTSIQITIKNLKFCKLSPVSEKYRRRYSWYFVCVLQSGTKVIASKVVEPEAIEINFPDYFQFEGHTHDLKIDVSLYALVLKNNIKKKNKNSQKMTTSQLTDCAPTHSFFTLWGKTQMRPCQITRRTQNVLALSKVPAEASISNAFTADVETRLKINITMKGFLTIGTDFKGCPVWNRRWCVLEGSRIKYWNHPNEETLMAPIGQVDLLKTLTHQVELVDKEFCPRPRTLSLEVIVEGPGPAIREYFLSADSWSEFEEWSRQLNLVLGYLRKWENIVCYLDN